MQCAKRFALAVLLFCLSENHIICAATVNLECYFSNYTSQASSVSRVEFNAIPPPAGGLVPPAVLLPTPRVFTVSAYPTLTNGYFTISNAQVGFYYDLLVSDPFRVNRFRCYLDNDLSGTTNIVWTVGIFTTNGYFAYVFPNNWRSIVTNIAAAVGGVSPTNTTELPGIVTSSGRGIGTNLATLTTRTQSTNDAAYQALIATNNYASTATNIAAYQALIATQNLNVTFTNNTALPGVVSGSGIGTNIATLQPANVALSNVVNQASNRYVGSFAGTVATGDATNAAGSRVAYLSDTNGLGASAQTNISVAGVTNAGTAAYSNATAFAAATGIHTNWQTMGLADTNSNGNWVTATNGKITGGITNSSSPILTLDFTTGAASSALGTATFNMFSGNGASLTALNASQLTSGTVGSAVLTGSNAYNGSFTGNGAGLTNLPASSISNVATNNGNNQFSSGQTINGAISSIGATNTSLTASRLILTDANKGEVSAAASGAVPVDADGSATTAGQLQAILPATSTNTYYASNAISGGQFPAVVLATNPASTLGNEFLQITGDNRRWNSNATLGGSLTVNGVTNSFLGMLGVGAVPKEARMVVNNQSTNSSGVINTIRIISSGGAGGDGSAVEFVSGDNYLTAVGGYSIARVSASLTGIDSGSLFLEIANGTHGTYATAMTLLGSGNVGIGTTGPLNKLDIAGALVVGGTAAGTITAAASGLYVEGVSIFAKSLGATNGIASYSSITPVAIAATGWTNIWSTNNAVVIFDGTTVFHTNKLRNNTPYYTNVAALGHDMVILQPGEAVDINGTGVTGIAKPF
jgi:hypothetical protein